MDGCDKNRTGNPFAKTILSSAGPDTYELYVSTQSIIDCAYSLRKLGVDYNEFCGLFRFLRKIAHIVGIDDLALFSLNDPNCPMTVITPEKFVEAMMAD